MSFRFTPKATFTAAQDAPDLGWIGSPGRDEACNAPVVRLGRLRYSFEDLANSPRGRDWRLIGAGKPIYFVKVEPRFVYRQTADSAVWQVSLHPFSQWGDGRSDAHEVVIPSQRVGRLLDEMATAALLAPQ